MCCRRPLDVKAVLSQLASCRSDFSVDFFLPSAEEMIHDAAPWLARASTIFVNAAEYRLLGSVLDTAFLPEVVVTDGPRAAHVRHLGRQTASVVPPSRAPREVSGAGDTFAGTFLAHRAGGATPSRSLAEAVAASAEYVTAPPLPIPLPRRA
ncbi:PfkB family carbohydrate kinase [Kitasatospora sp. MAP5-34]|uniref:PfkB family carbohydrate kinase n=1 Tax=Kitasatospora sp. MAP5-34 TaxID=3035102 RepID=UPI0032AF5E7B